MRRAWGAMVRAAGIGMLLASTAAAVPVDGTCTVEVLSQRAFVPQDLTFPVGFDNLVLGVTIDAEAGTIVFDGAGAPRLTFPNGFSSARDVFQFPPQDMVGTIDSAGNVLLPGLEFRACTFGVCPDGTSDCDCTPGNVCSNDTSRVCLAGTAPPDLTCDPPGVCQGVCSDDLTKTCAVDDDCLPNGFCGGGSLLRLSADLSTGFVTFGELQLVGSGIELFDTGRLTLVDIFRGNPETPIVGTNVVTSITLACVLDPIPSPDALPAASYLWSVKRGKVKLGKEGPGAADDKIGLKGAFVAPDAVADFGAADLSILLNTDDDGLIASITVPAGSMKANAKGTKYALKDKAGTVVQVQPALPPGAAPSHKVKLKRRKSGDWALGLSSKGMNLDALATTEVISGIVIEGSTQVPSDRRPVKANRKGNKLKF